jgi:catechol 2,3-dioxygenase-like lactoylglutathione lyase family enzyme
LQGDPVVAHLHWAGYSGLLLVEDGLCPGAGMLKNVGLRFHFWLEGDLYAFAARVVQAGGMIVSGPTTHPWEIREVTFRDPDGYLLTFCQQLRLQRVGVNRLTWSW